MTSILTVPYVGQVGNGANEHYNDCGAACAGMIIKFAGLSFTSVDAIYNEINPVNDTYLSVGGLMGVLLSRGIDCDWDAGISTDRLRSITDGGNPCIALIDYGDLEAVRPNPFDGSHFVVVTGVDDSNVTINDPLNTPTSGEGVKIPRWMWDNCWTNLDDQNPDRGLIIVNEVFSVMIGTILPDGDALAYRSRPFTNMTGSQVIKRLRTGVKVDIQSIEAIWGKTTDGRFVAIKYDGIYLIDVDGIDL